MSDDNSDEIMIGPMPAVEDYSALTLTTIEPEDNTEGTTLVSSGSATINQHKNNNSNDHNNSTNGFDNNIDYVYQDNASLANPPSPQALFFLSEMGDALDNLTYDHHILELAETNKVNIPWADLKPIVRSAILKQCDIMETVVTDTEVLSTITGIKTNILHCIDHHSGTPFTIQRLCELISAPTRYYTLFIKYLHAIEKVLSVASTWDSFCEETSTQAPSQPLPSQQQLLENDMYTGYEMPEVILSPTFDDGVELDNGNDDDDDDEDEDDEDDNDDKDMTDAMVTEDLDSMEMDSAPVDQQAIQTNGDITTNDHKDDAMDEDKDVDQDLEQDRQVPNSSNDSSSSNSSSNQ